MCPRSATVIAGDQGVTGHMIDQSAWQSFMASDLQSTLLHNYLIYQQKTIRESDVKRLAEVREKLRQEEMRVLSARFFVQMIIGLVIFTFTLGTLKTWFEEFDSTITGFGVLIVYAIGSALFVYQSGLPLENFGFTSRNFKSAMRYMMPMTALFIAVMFLFKWALITWAPEAFGSELISGFQAGELKISLWLMALLYCIHAAVQEFIARGCVQGGLHQFITGKGAATMSIVLSTMVFSVIHLIMNFNFALLTIVPGLFWGYLFYRQRNFWAVGISHILIGGVAFFILGFS
jgi:membrane protease YdiL (CAAX protease family)